MRTDDKPIAVPVRDAERDDIPRASLPAADHRLDVRHRRLDARRPAAALRTVLPARTTPSWSRSATSTRRSSATRSRRSSAPTRAARSRRRCAPRAGAARRAPRRGRAAGAAAVRRDAATACRICVIPTAPALEMLESVLSGGKSSRLYQRLVREAAGSRSTPVRATSAPRSTTRPSPCPAQPQPGVDRGAAREGAARREIDALQKTPRRRTS